MAFLLLLLGLGGCRGKTAPTADSGAALSSEQVAATWLWRVAFSEELPDALFPLLAARWLGGLEGDWGTLGGPLAKEQRAVHGGRTLEARLLLEDRLALGHLAAIHLQANCRLARKPDAYGLGLGQAYALGAAACAGLGDQAGQAAATANAARVSGGSFRDPVGASLRSVGEGGQQALAQLLVPEVKKVELKGESLEYALLWPAQLEAAQRTLELRERGLSPSVQGEGSGPVDLLDHLATSSWFAGAEFGKHELLSAAMVLGAAPVGTGRLAQVEGALEEVIAAWRSSLVSLPRDGAMALDAGGRSLLESWFRRALYRDVGLLALEEGDAELALVALEEAAGARGRVRPGAGLDPLLLAAMARARFECNELQRSVELLDDIGAAKGWEFALPVARTVARLAVVGSGADARVNR